MGKLVVTEFVSLDGVMEDPGGSEGTKHGAWTFKFDRGAAGDKFKLDELIAADAQLLGRVTYDGFAAAWPKIDAGEFSVKMNGMPKFVVSTTLTDPSWNNTTVLHGDVRDSVSELVSRYAGDILVAGSARLVQTLLAFDLVDELHLMVFPIVLGSGKRLFADGADVSAFELVSTQQTGEAAVLTLQRTAKSI